MDGVHDLLRRIAGAGYCLRCDPPHLRYMRPSRRIVDLASSGKLIAFLAMLATTLTVALAGNHRATAAFSPDLSRSQRQVDERQHVLNALRLMLETPRIHGYGPGS